MRETGYLPVAGRVCRVFALLGAVGMAACAGQPASRASELPAELAIGYAGATGRGEFLLQLTAEPLLQTTNDGLHEPRLAESWTVAEDGYVVTLRVRRGVTFHDGTELDARIVKEALDTARGDAGQRLFHPALADIRSISADGHELRIELERPSALLLDDLGIRIQKPNGDRLVGTGPFVPDGETEESVTLRANPDYYRGRPSIDVVTITGYPTVRAAWAAMMRDEIDVLFEVPISAREFVAAESRVELFMTDRPYAYAIGFNMQSPKFDRVEVRRALNHGVDRERIIEHALRGDGRPASGIWPSHWAYGGTERLYWHDPQLADQLLTEGGYPPVVRAGETAATLPARLRFTCLVRDGDAAEERIALIVQRQLYEIGVDMQLAALSVAELQARVAAGNYDAVLVPQNIGRTLSRLYTFWHSSQPFAQFGYTAADDVLDTLRHAPTDEAVARAADRFQHVVFDDPPAIFLAVPRQSRAVHRRFVIPVESERDVIETIWRWQRSQG